MKDKIALIIVIVIIIVAVVVLAIVFGGKKVGEEEIEGTNLKGVDIAAEIYGFSAEVVKIKDKTITMEGWIPLADEEAEPIKGKVKGVVTDSTKIVKLKFPEAIEESEEPVYPEEIEMSFEELKTGDQIDVSATKNISENIKNGTEFDLNHIFVIE